MQPIKILIVEDEAAIARDLESILEENNYKVTGIAHNYNQALQEIKSQVPDLALLDISLKGEQTGIDLAEHINTHYKFPFIFITSYSTEDILSEAISKSPGGYIVKPYKERDIPAAVKVALVNAKSKVFEFPTIEKINFSLEKGISRQEYKVLKYIWEGDKNAVISKKLFVSTNTVKSHITRVFAKLDVHSRAEAINKVLKS